MRDFTWGTLPDWVDGEACTAPVVYINPEPEKSAWWTVLGNDPVMDRLATLFADHPIAVMYPVPGKTNRALVHVPVSHLKWGRVLSEILQRPLDASTLSWETATERQ